MEGPNSLLREEASSSALPLVQLTTTRGEQCSCTWGGVNTCLPTGCMGPPRKGAGLVGTRHKKPTQAGAWPITTLEKAHFSRPGGGRAVGLLDHKGTDSTAQVLSTTGQAALPCGRLPTPAAKQEGRSLLPHLSPEPHRPRQDPAGEALPKSCQCRRPQRAAAGRGEAPKGPPSACPHLT